MYVTKTEVATSGGRGTAPIDTKDFGSKGVHMVTNCGVGASDPSAIYIRPFCIDTAVFQGDEALSDGEMPIRKALAPVEFAQDLKQQLEKIAPARILKDHERPRVGWLVEPGFGPVDPEVGATVKAAAEALKANKNLEKANDDLLTMLARSLLAPLGVNEGPLVTQEIEALWSLAESRDARLGPRFVEEALRSPMTTRQLSLRSM